MFFFSSHGQRIDGGDPVSRAESVDRLRLQCTDLLQVDGFFYEDVPAEKQITGGGRFHLKEKQAGDKGEDEPSRSGSPMVHKAQPCPCSQENIPVLGFPSALKGPRLFPALN